MTALETDYLVVGAGAAGMAFVDTLISHSDADVVLLDKRHRPGGHWNDAYPFVRLHLPSAYYGVASTRLGADRIDGHGPNAGLYERATAAELCDYFGRVLDDRLLPSGRVRFLGMTEHAEPAPGRHRLTSRLTGAARDVVVRRKVVDATYFEPTIPATHTPSVDADADVRVVPVNALVDLPSAPPRYVVLGGGKTAMDACGFLLDQGVPPDRIRWVRPRDAWLLDRSGWQPLDLVGRALDGFARDLEAVTQASSVDDLFQRLESAGRMLRLDPDVTPTMFRCASVSREELMQLRRVDDVVRLGRVVRIEPTQIVLEHGHVAADPDDLYVDCTASGARLTDPKPIFDGDRITLQQVRYCSPTFNAALIGYVEATRDEDATKNRLCPPNPYPTIPADWVRMMLTTLTAAAAWRGEPDLLAWMESCRLNLSRGVTARLQDPLVQQSMQRYADTVRPAYAKLDELAALA